MKKELFKHLIYSVIVLVGLFFALMLIGDPVEDMSLLEVIMLKGGAFLGLYLLIAFAKVMYRKNCLPDDLYKEEEV